MTASAPVICQLRITQVCGPGGEPARRHRRGLRVREALEPDIKKSLLEGMGGAAGRCPSGSPYLLGRKNTNDELREAVSRTLAEFDLKAEIVD